MSEEKLGVGVIGARMGYRHLDGYKENPHCEIIGICDTDETLLAQRKEEYGARVAVTDYRELLEVPEIKIVSVATPDYFHVEHSVAAMRAGKDVLCEKPLTLTLEEAKEIIAAVKETGQRFMIGQVCRYAARFVLAKAMIDRGDIGELYFVESEYAHSYENARGIGDWRVDARRHPFIGGGCHAVDLVRWIAGDMKEVFAYANHKCLPDWPVNDCLVAVYQFENGVIGKVMASIGCHRPYTMRSVFYGTEGTIVVGDPATQVRIATRKNLSSDFAIVPVTPPRKNVATEIAEFVDCILNDKPVLADVYEGARTVAACCAAVESAQTGKPVKIEALS